MGERRSINEPRHNSLPDLTQSLHRPGALIWAEDFFQAPKRRITMSDTIRLSNIHLGTGAEGRRRLQALRAEAAAQGLYWGGQPSVGRLVVALADELLAHQHQAPVTIEETDDEP